MRISVRNAAAAAALVAALTAASCSPTGSGGPTSAPAATTSTASTAPPSPRAPLAGTVVVVDPGHNGGNARHPRRIAKQVDAGGFRKPCNTTGTETDDGYPEHAFNWDVAKRLTKLLRADGATVVLTRKNDKGVGPCVDDRGRTAARHDADLLVSIHADGSAPRAHGFAVLRPAKVPDYTAATYRRSQVLAGDVADTLDEHGFTRSTYLGEQGIARRDDLGTLNRAGVPAVMLEAGNMRSSRDADLLSSRSGRQRLAKGLAAAIETFSERD